MKKSILLALLATAFVGCTQADIDETRPSSPEEVIYATIAEEEITRVELNNKKQTTWSAGDYIVRYGQDVHDVWEFAGVTGDRNGVFKLFGEWSDLVDFDFKGKYYSFYPYDSYAGLGGFQNGDKAIFYYIKSEQNYIKNSYDPRSNIMHGIGSDASNFTFKNLMGYLRLSLKGDKKVQSITLEGNNGEYLGGYKYIHLEDISINGWYSDVTTYMTLNCNGVQLTDIPTEFYFALDPTTFSQGISVTILFTDGTVFPQSTSKSIGIERNVIQPMATIDTGAELEWQTVTIQHSGDKVSAPTLYGYSALSGYLYWGDDYMSDLNSLKSYVYDDGISEHTITVKSLNATGFEIEDCTGISAIDLSNF